MTATSTELLAPAGSPEALDAAIGEGADAVYLGLKDFNARMRSANFTYTQFEGAIRALHRMGRKLYVTVNTVFEQREADRVYQLLKYLAALGPDGILVQDFGIITMARDNFPSLKLHASTQMNVASARGVNLLSRYGFSRVVLARELSLDEIRDIRANTNMELEVFVHGALCISVSGLCLFSSFLGGKSANRGMCTQACRRLYTPEDGRNFEKSGEENGGYYFSPADLELVGQIPDLVEAGVNSFKIEGRMKSAEYVGAVVSAYRLVIDNLDTGEENLKRAITDARLILRNDFARAKTVYLINTPFVNAASADTSLADIPPVNMANSGGSGTKNNVIDWLNPKQNGGTGIPLGALIKVRKNNTEGKDEEYFGLIKTGTVVPTVGDSIRLHSSDDSNRVSHKLNFVEEEPGRGCWISIPDGFGPGDTVYLIQTKAMTRRYAPVIKSGRDERSRGPGRDRAPGPTMGPNAEKAAGKQKIKPDFPEGIYAMVSRIEDLYILQSSRPEKAILPYSHKLAKQLMDNSDKKFPFPARDIILSLDPFFPQEKDKELCEEIPALTGKGYTQFIVNNPGHFSLFRKYAESREERNRITLVAGPWLYTFNAWAWSFISKCGATYCISSLENNRQNLERSFPREGPTKRSQVFITIYGRPSLFRIRQDLGSLYKFHNFSGTRNEAFFLASGNEGTVVYPQEPFSIVDKTPFLREASFTRFILDFSSGPLKKSEYREVMEAVSRAAPLQGTNRFNWKDGFYRNEADKE